MLATLLGTIAVASALADGPPPPITVSLNNGGQYNRGEYAKATFQAAADGYVLILQADQDGRIRVLFPLDPGDDNFIRGKKTYKLIGRDSRGSFYLDQAGGSGMVYAAWSKSPFRFADFVRGDHWDYNVIDQYNASDDPGVPADGYRPPVDVRRTSTTPSIGTSSTATPSIPPAPPPTSACRAGRGPPTTPAAGASASASAWAAAMTRGTGTPGIRPMAGATRRMGGAIRATATATAATTRITPATVVVITPAMAVVTTPATATRATARTPSSPAAPSRGPATPTVRGLTRSAHRRPASRAATGAGSASLARTSDAR